MHHLRLLLAKDLHSLEYDPTAQFKANRWFVKFWLAQMPLVIPLILLFPRWWLQISLVYLVEISLWALVSTHFGGMSAALAAGNYHCPGCTCGPQTVVITPTAPTTEYEQKLSSEPSYGPDTVGILHIELPSNLADIQAAKQDSPSPVE